MFSIPPFRHRNQDFLPKSRSGWVGAWLDRNSLPVILIAGLAIYSAVPFLISAIEYAFTRRGHPAVTQGCNDVKEFWKLVYFNFVTILTVGYGDYVPVSFGRALSIAEGVAGTILFGLTVAVATIKALQPPRNAIAFSSYGYYCLDEQRFLVIFVNTTRSVFVNPEMCSYYRQGNDFTVSPPYRAPFIRWSVWTFFVDPVPLSQLVHGAKSDNSLRFGITGQLGLSTVSAYVEYEPEEILVIPNRNELTEFHGFRNADLSNEEVRRMFHYRPPESQTLSEHLAKERKKLA